MPPPQLTPLREAMDRVLGPLTAFHCGEVMALHEERHCAQVDEIGAQLASVTA